AEQKTDADGSDNASDDGVIDFTYSTPDNEGAKDTTSDKQEASAEDSDHFSDVDVNWDDFYDGADSRVYTPSEPQDEERDFTDFVAVRENMYDSLNWQLHVSALDKEQVRIGDYIIGNLDDDGYLRIPL